MAVDDGQQIEASEFWWDGPDFCVRDIGGTVYRFTNAKVNVLRYAGLNWNTGNLIFDTNTHHLGGFGVKQEKVLAFPATLLPGLVHYDKATLPLVVKVQGGARLILDKILAPGKTEYIDRVAAEVDPTWKQLIPYCVFRHRDDVFVYRRTGASGDSRLHNRYSVGVGGHINPADGDAGANAYEAAFWRELDEELRLKQRHFNEVVGLLYDPTDEVGQVHFGVVHLFILPADFDRSSFDLKKDPALTQPRWVPLSWLKTGEPIDGTLERWSRLTVDKLL